MGSICDSYKDDPRFKETLRLVGDFWTLRIVAVLEGEDLRFCGIERALGDSNPATLTARLKKLEQSNIVTRREEDGDTVYALTSSGAKLLPIISQVHELSAEYTS